MKAGNLTSGVRLLALAAGLSVATMGNAQSDPVYGWTNFVGQPGSWGSANGIDRAAQFHSPRNTALDVEGNLYVADTSNDTIQKVTPAGVVTTLAGRAEMGGPPMAPAVRRGSSGPPTLRWTAPEASDFLISRNLA